MSNGEQPRDWRNTLEAEYAPTAQRLQSAYAAVERRLRPEFEAVRQRIDELALAGTLTVSTLRSLPEFLRLMQRVESELNGFGTLVQFEANQVAGLAIPLGAQQALQATLFEAGNASGIVQAAWGTPNVDALRQLIAYTDSEAFRSKWASFGETAAQQLQELYFTGLAQGQNPTAVARLASSWLAIPYTWAENSSRTAMIWSMRVANHATMAANSNILDGWYWDAALDARCCISCWDQHGSFHPLDETLNDHHRGRCTPRPSIRGISQPIELGADVFERLPEAQQVAIMGPGMHDAWKRGDVQWGQFSEPYTDPVYGIMLRAASLKSLRVR